MIGAFDDLSGIPVAGRIPRSAACPLDNAQPMG
jgi:hypothetical protein